MSFSFWCVFACLSAVSLVSSGVNNDDADDCHDFWSDGKRPNHQQCTQSNHTPLAGPEPWITDLPYDISSNRKHQQYFPEFIHIAKNGGGTISHVRFPGQEYVIGGPYNAGVTRFQKDGTKGCHDGETPPRDFKQYQNETTFCVVRHPLNHIISSMNFAAQEGDKHMKRGKDWVAASLRQMAIYIHEEQLRENNIGFLPETFDRNKFNETAESLAEKKLFIGEQYCHFLPQSDYIWDEKGHRTCNFVLRYEHFHNDFKILAELYGQDPTNSEAIHAKASEADKVEYSILEQDGFKKHAYDPKKKFTHEDMDDDLRNAYLQLYEVDLCLLGYDRDPRKPVESLLTNFIKDHRNSFEKCFHERDKRIVVH